MDFSDGIKAHAKRVADFKDHVTTEEATKMALIVPFMRFLGYEPNDPRVVIPEYSADFGNKKACKVDYAIKRGGDIVIIIEAKKVGEVLDGVKEAQLQQYFQSLLTVKIAILTDGVVYKFFTDLDHKNVMDKKPFMTLDFNAVEEALIPEIKKLCNDCFDLETALDAAQELKYLGQLKKLVAEEIESPSEGFIRHFASQIYDGRLTEKVIEGFRTRIKSAFEHHINDILNSRLRSVMQLPGDQKDGAQGQVEGSTEPVYILGNRQGDGIETTPQEVEGYYIVRAIISDIAAPERIFARDAASYCSIILDDNNRKPICRLRFNNPAKLVLETFDQKNKTTTLHKLDKVLDIYQHTGALRAVIGFYAKGKEPTE
ncbi:MAG: restriction endonuclease [Desulfovibrionaceae bacterium]|nr:restriction endonuclease [Desulfovibrionaceae bacterium]